MTVSLETVAMIAGLSWLVTQGLKIPISAVDPRLMCFVIAAVLLTVVYVAPGVLPLMQLIGAAATATLGAGALHSVASGGSTPALIVGSTSTGTSGGSTVRVVTPGEPPAGGM